MAIYDVNFSCGHPGKQYMIEMGKRAHERIHWLEENGYCKNCLKEMRAVKHQKEDAISLEESIAKGFPMLTGGEKQVPWANTIRLELIQACQQEIDEIEAEGGVWEDLTINDMKKCLDYIIRNHTAARWWLDHRNKTGPELIGLLFPSAKIQVKKEEAENIPEANEAKVEATVRPEVPKTETVAEIRLLDNSLEVYFPEKLEEFRKIVKSLGYHWDDLWKKRIRITDGTMQDRAAETGNKLLCAGYIIRIFDPEVRQRAIDGIFEAAHTRWIKRCTEDKYKGWFSIWWSEKNESLYQKSRKLRGSKWDGGGKTVVVPPESFLDVLGFADMYEFKLTAAAEAVVRKAQAEKEASLIAKPVAAPEYRLPDVLDKPAKLYVPNEVDIDASLRDED